jgi:hypothetical protein
MMLDLAYGRATANSTARPDLALHAAESIPGNNTAIMLALAAASKAWWESRRPQSWTLEQHLTDPLSAATASRQNRRWPRLSRHAFGGAPGRVETQAVTATHGARRLTEAVYQPPAAPPYSHIFEQ